MMLFVAVTFFVGVLVCGMFKMTLLSEKIEEDRKRLEKDKFKP